MKNDYIKGLEKELDSLISDSSEFVYVGVDKVKVLVDKVRDYPVNGLKIRPSKSSERYVLVEQALRRNGIVSYGVLGRNILGLKRGDLKVVCDHINRNPLDNRKVNLREATRSQNSINRVDDNTSGYKHVFVDKKYGNKIVEFSFRVKRTGSGKKLRLYFNKNERASCLGMLADCISVLYDKDFCITNFDKSIYTDVFIDTYLQMFSVDKENVMNCIKLSKSIDEDL